MKNILNIIHLCVNIQFIYAFHGHILICTREMLLIGFSITCNTY